MNKVKLNHETTHLPHDKMPPHVVTVTYVLTHTFTVPDEEYTIDSVRADKIHMKDGRIVLASTTHTSPPVCLRGQRVHIRF